MLDHKPLPQHEPKTKPVDNTKLIFICISLGLFSGLIITTMAINNNDNFYTNETCQELINNSSIISYQTGLFDIINYTSSTGAIKIIYNNSIVDTNVCEYCDYIQQINQGVING